MPKNQTDHTDVINMAEERATRKKSAAAHFGDYVEGELRANEIEEGLSEIYQDDNGEIVDMKNVEIVHGRSWLFRALIWILNLGLIAILCLIGYYYFNQYQSANDTASIDFTITGSKEVTAGQDIEYTVTYRNLDKIDLRNVTAKTVYPDNFIFVSADPAPSQGNDFWQIGNIDRSRSGEIKIKGKLIGEIGKNSILLSSLAYTPSNFSSEFRKDASAETIITSTGLDFNFDFPASVMVNESNDLYISYRQLDGLYLDKIRLTLSKLENLSFGSSTSLTEPGVVYINLASTTTKATTTAASTTPISGELRLPLTFKSRINNKENITINFEYSIDGQNYHSFFKRDIEVDVLTKSINLDLLINASKEAQGVDFGQQLNYSIGYANKGDQSMKDLVVMAVIDGDFIDWKTLTDKTKGKVVGNKIVWTKSEIPDLASLIPGQEGTIDFSVNLIGTKDINLAKNYQIKNFARFSFGSASTTIATSSATTTLEKNSETNRSNEIVLKINSDLSLGEEVRYFDDDNIAVGSGPQPPHVDQTTSYKVYWKLANSLNELVGVKVETTLPAYVNYEEKNTSDIGAITFDSATRKVSWNIAKMPITATKADGSFNISVTPTSTDANRIMMLINNTAVTAKDSITGNIISKTGKAKTSKLLDDSAVSDDGVVVK